MHKESATSRGQESVHDHKQPKDRFHLVYILFFILGVGSLLPYNMFITANLYFSLKLEGTQFVNTFENYLTVASAVPNVIASAISVRLLRSFQLKTRLVFSLSVLIAILILTTVLVRVDTSAWKETFFIVTIASVIFMSLFGFSISQSAIFGLAGVFPKEYTQAVVTGQALAGIFAAVASIISLLGGDNPYNSALGYFCCAVIVLFFCLLAYFILNIIEFARFYMRNLEYDKKSHININVGNEIDELDDYDDTEDLLLYKRHNDDKSTDTTLIMKKIWPVALSVLVCFAVTLSVFPSVTARIQSVHKVPNNIFTDKLFIPLSCFLMFNVADFVGRLIALWLLVPNYKHGVTLLALSISRVAFVPLLLYCNAQPRIHLPVKIKSDAAYIIIITFLGLSNGYIASLSMMYGPKRVPSDRAETTGAIMNFCLVLGLAIGSALSFATVALL